MELANSIPRNNLRDYLRCQTAPVHERLDKTVGEIADAAAYRTFVAQSFAFRSAVEPSILHDRNWAPLPILDALRDDLHDLGQGVTQVSALEPLAGAAGNIGRLYVLEGSSIGARILYQRARMLGYTGCFGARHLARQTGEQTRWKLFTEFLESVEDVDHAEVVAAATHLFEFAIDESSQQHREPSKFNDSECI